MQNSIEINLDRVDHIVKSFSHSKFSTADIIREYSGGFFSNIGTPAAYSLNAQFGKILKRNSGDLGIKEVERKVAIKDDNGHQTSTTIWSRGRAKARRKKL